MLRDGCAWGHCPGESGCFLLREDLYAWGGQATPLPDQPEGALTHARCLSRHRAGGCEADRRLPRSRCTLRFARDWMRQEFVRCPSEIDWKRRAHEFDVYGCSSWTGILL